MPRESEQPVGRASVPLVHSGHARTHNLRNPVFHLQNELEGEVFEPLKDTNYFKRLEVHPELHTLTWPNGADFAPEFLYEKIKVPA